MWPQVQESEHKILYNFDVFIKKCLFYLTAKSSTLKQAKSNLKSIFSQPQEVKVQ